MRKTRAIRLKAKPRFAIVVDGECEFWYIQMFKRNERSIGVNLEPKIPQRKKLSEQYKIVQELSKDYSKVFWILDFDVLINESRQVKRGAKSSIQELKEYQRNLQNKFPNVVVIVNNPCIEYWLLLHYEQTAKYYNTCKDAEKQLKKHLPSYEKTQKYYTKQDDDIYLKHKSLLNQAITNSNKLDQFDIDQPHNGVSQMHLFFETAEIKKLYTKES